MGLFRKKSVKNDKIGSDHSNVVDETGLKQDDAADSTTEYLRKRGLAHLEHQIFQVSVQLPTGETVTIPLQGRQNSRDALNVLEDMGHLSSGRYYYRFSDWPKADPCIGPWYHHFSACVCELPPRIYHVDFDTRDDMTTLYGCPNPRSIDYSGVLKRLSIKVIDYGE